MKRPLIVLALLTSLLGGVGLYSHLDAGLSSLLLVVGLSSLLAAGTVTAEPRFGAPASMCLGVATVALAFTGLAHGVPGWMAWMTFWMGAAYLLMGVAGGRLWRQQHAWLVADTRRSRPYDR